MKKEILNGTRIPYDLSAFLFDVDGHVRNLANKT